jgi:hypothetical protein
MLFRPLSGSYSHWPGRCACQIAGGLCSPVGMIIAARGNRTAVSAHFWVGDPIAVCRWRLRIAGIAASMMTSDVIVAAENPVRTASATAASVNALESTLVTLAAQYVANAELAIRSDPSHRSSEFVEQFLGGSAVGFAHVLVLRCSRLHRACVVPDSTKMPHPSVIGESTER